MNQPPMGGPKPPQGGLAPGMPPVGRPDLPPQGGSGMPQMVKPGMPQPGPAPAPQPGPAPAPQPGPAPAPQPGLMNQQGDKPTPHLIREKTGEEIMFDKPEFTIGRSEKADHMISENSDVSRIHAVIVQRNGVNYIKDNNSTNHTYVDGKELAPGEEALLKNGAKIVMGNEEFTFHLRKGE